MSTFNIISPLIFVVALGYWCAKSKWLSKNQLDGISKLTFNLCIPAFLFINMATAEVSETLSLPFFLSFYIPVLACYALAGLSNFFFHPKLKYNYQASSVFALGSSYSNTVIVGLPILLLMYGQQAVILIFAIVTFHSAMLFTLTSIIAAKNKQSHWFLTLVKTFKNPLLISIIAGAIINLLPLTLPSFIEQSLTLISKPALTLALFVLGASLTFFSLKAELNFVIISSVFKLLLLPVLVYLTAIYFMNLPLIQRNVLVILSACPTGVNAFLMAKEFNSHQQNVASTVVITTIMSIFTLTFWIWWLT